MPSHQQKTASARASRREAEAAYRSVDDELGELMDLHRSASDKVSEAVSSLEDIIGFVALLENAVGELKGVEPSRASSFREVSEASSSVLKALGEIRSAVDALVDEKKSTAAILRIHARLCARLDFASASVASAAKAVSRMGSSFDNAPRTSIPAFSLGRRLRIPDVIRTVHAAASNLSRVSKMSRALASFHSRAVQDIARSGPPYS